MATCSCLTGLDVADASEGEQQQADSTSLLISRPELPPPDWRPYFLYAALGACLALGLVAYITACALDRTPPPPPHTVDAAFVAGVAVPSSDGGRVYPAKGREGRFLPPGEISAADLETAAMTAGAKDAGVRAAAGLEAAAMTAGAKEAGPRAAAGLEAAAVEAKEAAPRTAADLEEAAVEAMEVCKGSRRAVLERATSLTPHATGS